MDTKNIKIGGERPQARLNKRNIKSILRSDMEPHEEIYSPSRARRDPRMVRFKDFSGSGRKKMRRNATLNDIRRGKYKYICCISHHIKNYFIV